MRQGQVEGCQWPEGCNRGGFRSVVMADGSCLTLCLRHAGRRWNERIRENRAAGRCGCGAEASPGRATCERCRMDRRQARRHQRRVNAAAAELGITLPRSAGRRLAFWRAYVDAKRFALRHAQRAARRASHRAVTDGVSAVTCPVAWEDCGAAVRVEVAYRANPAKAAAHLRELEGVQRLMQRIARRRERERAAADRRARQQARQREREVREETALRRECEGRLELTKAESLADRFGIEAAFGTCIPPASSRWSPEALLGNVEGRRRRDELQGRGWRTWEPSLAAIRP